MKIKEKHLIVFYCGGYVPRKIRRRILGHKVTKKKLKQMLSSLIITRHPYPKESELSDEFCPKCGCKSLIYYSYEVPYPEVWSELICGRCGFVVGCADNSPFVWTVDDDEGDFTDIITIKELMERVE